MKLAVGIPTWRDGRHMLEATIDSLDGIADELIIADGLIRGVETDLGHLSEWLPEDGEHVHVIQRYWRTQSEKRTWLLERARELGCDWLLQIDADERLHNAGRLKAWLPTWSADAFPVPFEVDPGRWLGASWKCVRVAAWRRVVAGGAYLEHADGNTYCVVPEDGIGPGVRYLAASPELYATLPWISHHPQEREGVRVRIRLGELEDWLEPPPEVPYKVTPGLTPRSLIQPLPVSEGSAEATYYCDQCGARYAGPGLCENGHAPHEVTSLSAAAAAETGQDPAESDAAEQAETVEEDSTAVPSQPAPPVAAPPVADPAPPAAGEPAASTAADAGAADAAASSGDAPAVVAATDAEKLDAIGQHAAAIATLVGDLTAAKG